MILFNRNLAESLVPSFLHSSQDTTKNRGKERIAEFKRHSSEIKSNDKARFPIETEELSSAPSLEKFFPSQNPVDLKDTRMAAQEMKDFGLLVDVLAIGGVDEEAFVDGLASKGVTEDD
ncbi:hypothetical protein U1Q18_020565 [Sarracenia purpurea var. burkii]